MGEIMTQFAGLVGRKDDRPRIPQSLAVETSPPTVAFAIALVCCPSGDKLVMLRLIENRYYYLFDIDITQ